MEICCISGKSNWGSVIAERGGKGWEVGGRFKREGTYVYLWLIHVDVWQQSNQYCKAIQFSSVTHSRPTLCDPMDCSTPGLPVHHQLLEFTQTHAHWVSDTIQPSVICFSTCLQSFLASGSFQMSQFFASCGQSIFLIILISLTIFNWWKVNLHTVHFPSVENW